MPSTTDLDYQAPSDPVFRDEEDALWYFWDETWSNRIGPYISESMARAELARYVRTVLG